MTNAASDNHAWQEQSSRDIGTISDAHQEKPCGRKLIELVQADIIFKANEVSDQLAFGSPEQGCILVVVGTGFDLLVGTEARIDIMVEFMSIGSMLSVVWITHLFKIRIPEEHRSCKNRKKPGLEGQRPLSFQNLLPESVHFGIDDDENGSE